jgi:hypothetical protein
MILGTVRFSAQAVLLMARSAISATADRGSSGEGETLSKAGNEGKKLLSAWTQLPTIRDQGNFTRRDNTPDAPLRFPLIVTLNAVISFHDGSCERF